MANQEKLDPLNTRPRYNHNDLFRLGPNIHLNACVGINGGPYNFEDYAVGYFSSGERLYKTMLTDIGRLDVLVYPLVYLYRHAVELGLKHLIKVLPLVFEEEEKVRLTHNLIDNWGVVKLYLHRIESDFDYYFNEDDTSISDSINFVDAVFRDLVAIDSDGQSFRFPESRQGENTLQTITHINVEVFSDSMKEVEKYFSYWFELIRIIWEDYAECRDYLM